MKFSDSLKTTKEKVTELLSEYPELRDSDKLLWLAYMNKHHQLRYKLGANYLDFKKILLSEDVPTMESITRARRKIQEEGQFVGSLRSSRLSEEKETRKMIKTL